MSLRNKTLLVDADIVAYQFAVVNQDEYIWDEETTSKVTDLDRALEQVDYFIEGLMKTTKASKALFCFSSSPNFRYSVLPTYKHNRTGEKPELYSEVRAYIEDKYECKTKPNLEADDVLGILSTLNPEQMVIATIDKDLMQIQGHHYNWRKDEYVYVTQEQADRFFYRQILMGDPTDGYSGCPYIGVKRAEDILIQAVVDEKSIWEAIVEAYEAKGLTEEYALQQARVARILRAEDYDFENQEVILWAPKKK